MLSKPAGIFIFQYPSSIQIFVISENALIKTFQKAGKIKSLTGYVFFVSSPYYRGCAIGGGNIGSNALRGAASGYVGGVISSNYQSSMNQRDAATINDSQKTTERNIPRSKQLSN